MFDFTKESREELAETFRALNRSLENMDQLPHEMVAMFMSRQDEKQREKLKCYWAEYLEYLAKLVREVSPLFPD